MVELIGRDRELADLEGAWTRAGSGVPQLAVVWGRRRVGKTFLLTRFAAAKRAVYFTATRQDSNERQLARARRQEQDAIPEKFVYAGIPGLSREVVERLTHVRPGTLAQAARIPGVTPAAVAIVAGRLNR